MKRFVLLVWVLLLALPWAALAEPVLYADQGGVRVFAEAGKVGLMDAGGNVLLPAEYDEIGPFRGDYAAVERDKAWGVARRDGTWAVDPAPGAVEIYPEQRLAARRRWDADWHVLYDLETGETLAAGPESLEVAGQYIYKLSYGKAGWGYEPPFHTDVLDRAGNAVFSGEVWFVKPFGELSEDYAVVQHEDGTYAVVDRDWREVLSGLSVSSLEIADGCVFYQREVENPLAETLEALNLGRKRVMRGLRRFLGADKVAAEELTEFMGPLRRCGVRRPDGSVTEVPGAGMLSLGQSAAPYCVKATGWNGSIDENDRWGYVDEAGEYVIPPIYRQAFPFVDGTAVVREGETWHQIDETGARVGDIEWSWDVDMWDQHAFAQRVIPIGVDGGFRLIDRRGALVTDEVFVRAELVFAERYLALYDAAGNLCLWDGDGRELLRTPCENFQISSGDPDALWIRRDGLYGLMGLDGAWLIEPCAERVEWVEDQIYAVQLPEEGLVYMNRAGERLGPKQPVEIYW